MSVPPALRSLLLNGPGPSHYDPVRYGGSAVVHAAWGRHKAELIAACKPGVSPLGILAAPAWDPEACRRGRTSCRLIRKLELYRDEEQTAAFSLSATSPRRKIN